MKSDAATEYRAIQVKSFILGSYPIRGFLAWAVVDRISVKRRTPEQQHAVPGAPPRPANDAIALVGGLAVYAILLLGGHRWLVGVSPLG